MQWARKLVCTIAAMSSLFVAGSQAEAMAEATGDMIPTMLVIDDDMEYPDPICGKCTIHTRRRTGTDGSSHAVLLIDHDNDWNASPHGDIELTVFLDDGTREHVIVEAVFFGPGSVSEKEVDTPTDWNWDHAEYIWARVLPNGQ